MINIIDMINKVEEAQARKIIQQKKYKRDFKKDDPESSFYPESKVIKAMVEFKNLHNVLPEPKELTPEQIDKAIESMKHGCISFVENKPLPTIIPTDEFIEKEAEKRYGEITGGQYQAARPMDKARFIRGAKWMRDYILKY